MVNKRTKSCSGLKDTTPDSPTVPRRVYTDQAVYDCSSSIDSTYPSTCVWCLNGSYDEIDYIEELMCDDARVKAAKLGVKMRNRYNKARCQGCRRKRDESEYRLENVLEYVLGSDEDGEILGGNGNVGGDGVKGQSFDGVEDAIGLFTRGIRTTRDGACMSEGGETVDGVKRLESYKVPSEEETKLDLSAIDRSNYYMSEKGNSNIIKENNSCNNEKPSDNSDLIKNNKNNVPEKGNNNPENYDYNFNNNEQSDIRLKKVKKTFDFLTNLDNQESESVDKDKNNPLKVLAHDLLANCQSNRDNLQENSNKTIALPTIIELDGMADDLKANASENKPDENLNQTVDSVPLVSLNTCVNDKGFFSTTTKSHGSDFKESPTKINYRMISELSSESQSIGSLVDSTINEIKNQKKFSAGDAQAESKDTNIKDRNHDRLNDSLLSLDIEDEKICNTFFDSAIKCSELDHSINESKNNHSENNKSEFNEYNKGDSNKDDGIGSKKENGMDSKKEEEKDSKVDKSLDGKNDPANNLVLITDNNYLDKETEEMKKNDQIKNESFKRISSSGNGSGNVLFLEENLRESPIDVNVITVKHEPRILPSPNVLAINITSSVDEPIEPSSNVDGMAAVDLRLIQDEEPKRVNTNVAFPNDILSDVLNIHSIGVKINKYEINNNEKPIMISSEQHIVNRDRAVSPATSEIASKHSTPQTEQSEKSMKLLDPSKHQDVVHDMLVEATERVKKQLIVDLKTGRHSPKHIKRFVLPEKDKISCIDSIVAINGLKTDIIIGKIDKRGKNGYFQNNWFQLKDTNFTCYNGKKVPITLNERPNESYGDLIHPQESGFFLRRKYFLNVKASRLFLVLNTGQTKNTLARLRCNLLLCRKRDELIDLSDKTIKNIAVYGEDYQVFIKDKNGVDFTYLIPFLEFAIDFGGNFYHYRCETIGLFYKWILAIELRQEKVAWPIP